MNLIRHNFPTTQYIQEKTTKRQIVLHHTASGPGVDGDIAWWTKTPERVATHFIIDREGTVHQLFDETFWAYHLGLGQKVFTQMKVPYKQLDRQSIGIEIDCWGYLVPHTDGKFYPAKWNGTSNVPNTSCRPVEYYYEYCRQNKWKGHAYYEKYTTRQLAALKDLLKELTHRHSIPKNYNGDMWAVSARALRGEPGIFAHCSYRNDKSDVHPQPELVTLLKMLHST